MEPEQAAAQVLVVKDGESERPIPTVWRSTIQEIVRAFVRHDYQLSQGVADVAPVPAETSERIKSYIQDYGAQLIELPEETWASSICIWMGTRWDLLVDLWSDSEGRSDLVLRLRVFEGAEGGFHFSVYMVHVP